jgi:predicted DNA-binding antitoxin AbrB/MazE fold protein
MVKICNVVFDGNVFLPKEPVTIQPDTECVVFISDVKAEDKIKEEVHPLELISLMAIDMEREDLSENFDYYTRRKLIADE